MLPSSLTVTMQPVKVGLSPTTIMSSGSPSSAFVPGTNPKSNGKLAPAGSTLCSENSPHFSSNLNLLRLPAGVSMITFTSPKSVYGCIPSSPLDSRLLLLPACPPDRTVITATSGATSVPPQGEPHGSRSRRAQRLQQLGDSYNIRTSESSTA